MITPNRFFLYFLAFFLACALGYTIYAGLFVYQYARLTNKAAPLWLEWVVLPKGEEKFMLQGSYEFAFKNTVYQAKMLWPEHYLNAWAAAETKEKFGKQDWTIWFDPNQPTYASLQKQFPGKQCLSASIVWCLFIYFVLLGRYAAFKHLGQQAP